MTPSLPLVSFEHVTIRDRGRVLLPDLSLRLDAGQHLTITGPGGAGKSALLAALAGVLPATGGRAEWPQLAAEARALPPRPRGIAASWQRLVCQVGPRAPFRARPGQSSTKRNSNGVVEMLRQAQHDVLFYTYCFYLHFCRLIP